MVQLRCLTTGDSTSLSFKLTYPENSQFVVVVSDSSGFGTGGTSVAAQVQTGSDDSTCYDFAQASPPFTFSITPANQLVQCSSTRIWWDPNQTQGNVQFYGVIPGGQSFQLNQGTLSTVKNEGYGFNWIVPVRASTTVLLVGGDNRGIGAAGWTQQNIELGDNTCLDSSSPSSTPGSPAGGAYPTGSNGAGTGSGGNGGNGGNTIDSSRRKTNLGTIVGGAVGGGVALIVILLVGFCFIRRRWSSTPKHRPIDLLQDHDEEYIPQLYQPKSFRVPDSNIMSSSYEPRSYDPYESIQASTTASLLRSGPDATAMSSFYGSQSYDPYELTQASTASPPLRSGSDAIAMSSYGRQSYGPLESMEASASTFLLQSNTLDPHGLGVGSNSGSSQTQNSSQVPEKSRPVRIVFHDDAGIAEEEEERRIPEIIEFPPAYSNIQNS
ncbi:hypothetical protein PILCRDRAFT_804429 [Piloderma croceum F 1598]|uniref:Uncharacterized protein n=1 Tax=Piloderma croceum (strain F 1598) TaxID=765440 RepID=A0A0C3ADX6_PILCF|nr:hypothetical protein PILCRDRAFT_804429 [Piloderma croceum F 1598]